MWIVIVLAIIGFIIYSFNKDYKKSVETNVTSQGGMQTKYKTLINHFTKHPSARITKVTKDSLVITATSISTYIDNVGGNTEVAINAFNPLIGEIRKRWKFPDGYPQEKMIQEIENYLQWKITEYQNHIENYSDKYLNDE